ncbi:HAMP domain-containing protein [Pseudomonas sp. R5(2019)]|nr:methyl-accepting chemotaxis protein [Pseudomonas sp. R5(2019)]NBA94097.1 HAMP domain-containing protein [Pseudomonas sp. R5(2019)]
MYRWFAQKLGNISVNLKLGLGFSLVLLLTLLITATGWLGLGGVINRGDTLGAISGLSELTQALRINRFTYTQDSTAEAANAVVKVLDDLDKRLQSLRLRLEQPQDIARLDKQATAVAEYRRAFSDLTQAVARREASRDNLGSSAERAVSLISQIENTLLQGESLSQFNSISELGKLVQRARYQVRGYTYSGNSEYEQGALAAVDQAIAALDALPGKVPGEHAANLGSAADALTAYRQAVVQYSEAQQSSTHALNRMQLQGTVLLQMSSELTTSQTQVRDEDSASARSTLALVTLLALLFGIVSAWVITRQIVIPLRQTLTAVERVADGDLSHDLKVERRDEMGQLQHSIQRMTRNLRELIGGIGDGVTQIASAAEELSAVTEQTSAGVNNQKVETDQVATAMNEMTATVQEVARNAEEASEAAVAADQQAREGDKVVSEAIRQIERLAAEVGHSTDAMNQLKQESGKIGSVLDVIKSVAEQTNLLALNAAIEAARAGEAGRGFAVVADEVRSLAQRTQKSTEEIEELIAGLQHGTQQVASAMDSSRELTDSSVDLTRRAGTALETITQTVSAIQAMNQQIAAAAEQQSSVAEEVNRSVMNVRDISDQTAAASEETAASSVELARLGTHLQGLVGRFRI